MHTLTNPLIEVCVEGLAGAKIAINAGADRIELNSALSFDGLTPSLEDLIATKRLSSVPVVAMLRPHANGFYYDRATQSAMLHDLERLLASGADGVAVGGLTQAGEMDLRFLAGVRKLTGSATLVMHRAFDQLRDQATGLEQLVDLGIDRVLTSGGQATAELGASQLSRLVDQSRGRIQILPGAGIRLENASRILEQTGCDQLHGTFRQPLSDPALPDPATIAELKKLRILRLR